MNKIFLSAMTTLFCFSALMAAEGGGEGKKPEVKKEGTKNKVETKKAEEKAEGQAEENKKPAFEGTDATKEALKKLGWEEMTGTWEQVPRFPARFRVKDGKLTHSAADGHATVAVLDDKANVSLLCRVGQKKEGQLLVARGDERNAGVDVVDGDTWYARGYGCELNGLNVKIFSATGRFARGNTQDEMDPVFTRNEPSKMPGRHVLSVALVKDDLQIFVDQRRVVKSTFKLRPIGPIELEVKGETIVELTPLRVMPAR
jgi:hypothetical protein